METQPNAALKSTITNRLIMISKTQFFDERKILRWDIVLLSDYVSNFAGDNTSFIFTDDAVFECLDSILNISKVLWLRFQDRRNGFDDHAEFFSYVFSLYRHISKRGITTNYISLYYQ